jgi:hypothetical protein
MNYFVTVTKQADDAVIEIDGGGRNEQFPLTKRGCLAAGRYLFNAKQESWMCSSSVDFPKEVKPTFRHNVHDLIQEGFSEAANPSRTPKDGTVLNGAFWLNGESWLIMQPQMPLNEYLAQSLQEQRQYIERLTKRADALEKWLDSVIVP